MLLRLYRVKDCVGSCGVKAGRGGARSAAGGHGPAPIATPQPAPALAANKRQRVAWQRELHLGGGAWRDSGPRKINQLALGQRCAAKVEHPGRWRQQACHENLLAHTTGCAAPGICERDGDGSSLGGRCAGRAGAGTARGGRVRQRQLPTRKR